MRPWVAVAHEAHRPGIQALFGTADRLLEGLRHRLVQHTHTTARSFGHFQPEQPGVLFATSGAQSPDLPCFQRLFADTALALDLRRGNEFLRPFGAQRVAVRVAEFGRTDALLLQLGSVAWTWPIGW